MFDALFGPKFPAKCKQSIKCIKARVYERRKKKQALLNFLKKDIADLLAIDHEANAFGRMDRLIVEMNFISCYDMIENFCDCIMNELPILKKSRECPQEDMEAVSTLMFAAARFSDLPELSNLRRVFTNRYGSSMESSVFPEFVEKVSKKTFGKDRKLKLMQEIAHEFSVVWDSEDFGKNKSSPPVNDHIKKGDPIHDGKEDGILHDTLRQEVPPMTKDIHVISDGNNGTFLDEPKHTQLNKTDSAIHTPIQPRIVKVPITKGDHETDSTIHEPRRAQEQTDCIVQGRQAEGELTISDSIIIDRDGNVTGAIQKQVGGPPKSDGEKPTTVVRPHIIPYRSMNDFQAEERSDKTMRDSKGMDPSISIAKPTTNRVPPYFRPSVSKNEVQIERVENDGAGCDKRNAADKALQHEDLFGDRKPKPRSVRRKHPKPPVVHGVGLSGDELADRITSGRKQGNQINERRLKDDCDEKEEATETLRMHYSKKRVGEQFEKRRTDRVVEIVEVVKRQTGGGKSRLHVMEQERGPSQPVSLTTESNSPEDVQMQRDALSPKSGRVHRRPSGCDELAARFNAFKSSSL